MSGQRPAVILELRHPATLLDVELWVAQARRLGYPDDAVVGLDYPSGIRLSWWLDEIRMPPLDDEATS